MVPKGILKSKVISHISKLLINNAKGTTVAARMCLVSKKMHKRETRGGDVVLKFPHQISVTSQILEAPARAHIIIHR